MLKVPPLGLRRRCGISPCFNGSKTAFVTLVIIVQLHSNIIQVCWGMYYYCSFRVLTHNKHLTLEVVVTLAKFSKVSQARKALSIFNSVAIYEAQLTQKSFLNQESFCFSTRRVHVNLLRNLRKFMYNGKLHFKYYYYSMILPTCIIYLKMVRGL